MPFGFSRFLVIAALFGLLSSCSRPPELVGIDNARIPVVSVNSANLRKVFLITTREASEVAGVFYSGQRAPNLGFALVTVSIPPNHVSGELERPKKLPPDPNTEFAIVDPVVFNSDSVFISHINRELAKLPPKDREILFFLHGYNNTVSDSLLRIAQFSEDTGFSGIPVLFSWASAARVSRYIYDLNSALIARPRLLEAAAILRRTDAKSYNLFAHSMGALLAMEAMVQAELAGKYNKNSSLLDNVMLAAPDIDIDLFRTQIGIFPKHKRNIFVFVSHDDRVLGFSRRISGGVERAGSANDAELAAMGVTVIDLSEVGNSTSGAHSKFAGSPEVVQLIGKSLKQNNFNKPSRAPTLLNMLDGVPVLHILTP
ncbi:MAG: alpha/beta hydrolase [Rhodobacteraceae bacterium]|nr:alpha/beta hydrolase [Paracoccaceae bacterium]